MSFSVAGESRTQAQGALAGNPICRRRRANKLKKRRASPMAFRSMRRYSAVSDRKRPRIIAGGDTRQTADARFDVMETGRGPIKCRIPRRLPPGRTRLPINSVAVPRAKTSNCPESTRQKYEAMSTPNSRNGAKSYSRSHSEDVSTRPKSANRLKEELFSKQGSLQQRTARVERAPFVMKRPPTMSRKSALDKNSRAVILVPVSTGHQRPTQKTTVNNLYQLSDQESVNRDRDWEFCETSPATSPTCFERSEDDSLTSQGENLMDLKVIWQDKMIQFDKMKSDLKELQNSILALYAKMRETHQKMASMGEKTSLPPAEDLRIMNVANMTPEQLLQLCAGDDITNMRDKQQWPSSNALTIDMHKLYEMPSKLVDTCEQTLAKRQEIINWFESLKSLEKGISVNKLSKKINEFNAENEMLKCSLDKVKADFLKQLEEIVNLMRKGINETMSLHLRNEELTYELSEMNAQNTDLRKRIQNSDHLRTQTNKKRIEDLEKELKEEKCKRLFMRDRLSRSEGQVKINVERAAQLEATLEQARNQIWSLERTVQQLHEQNQKLQSDFDKELNKLTEFIKEHTVHLEEIAEAREKLQLEKKDLEKRLTELSEYYKESHQNMKLEMNAKVAQLIETEKKYSEKEEEKQNVEKKVESLCTELLEAEQRHKSLLQQLNEKETLLSKELEVHKDLIDTKSQLEKSNLEISDYKELFTKQSETIKELERSLKEAIETTEEQKRDLSNKNDLITELEKKQTLIKQQLQENENKIEGYVEQLSSLKVHINQLQEDFGEFENLDELHRMINQQRAKLLESTRQNGELTETLQKKEKEIEHYNEDLSRHEQVLLEREGVIKMLSEKEEEQTNIIKILRNNLELRSQADNDLSQQVMEKNTEIESLLVNLETRKQQILNMEKIILTLEDQTRKASLHRKKDQEHIVHLQKRITEYESFHMEASRNVDNPENLDSLIKILEDELGTPIDDQLNTKKQPCHRDIGSKKNYLGDHKRDKLDCDEDKNLKSRYQSEPEPYSTKVIMGSSAKKAHMAVHGDDNLDRKKAITNMDTQNWVYAPELGPNVYSTPTAKENLRRPIPSPPQNTTLNRNLQFLNPDHQRNDRKYKMFKLAGHRL